MNETMMTIYKCAGCSYHVSEFMIYCSDACRSLQRLYRKLCDDEVTPLMTPGPIYQPIDSDAPPAFPRSIREHQDRFIQMTERARKRRALAPSYPDPVDD